MSARTSDEVYNQRLIVGLTTALLILCYIFYFLRILSRKLLQTPLWIDDWFMLFALFVCSGMSILNYVGLAYGSGVHRDHLEDSQYRKFQISLYVFMMFWALGVAVVKIGILLFYWRIFIVPKFRRYVALVGALLLTSSTAIFLSFMLQCNPIPRFWADTEEGYCINQVAFYMSGGSINIASDVLVLSLPMQQVWKLKASLQNRIALILLFSLGGFVCITSIIRLTALKGIDPKDFSYSNVGGALWSTAEVQVGFICANLPHMRSLANRWFRHWYPHIGTSHNGGSHPTNDHHNSPHTQSRSRRDTAGFHSLGSQSKSAVGPVTGVSVERRESSLEEADIGTYDSDHELTSMPAQIESGLGRVQVRTELRQEVQQTHGPRVMGRDFGWVHDTVMTEITAKGDGR